MDRTNLLYRRQFIMGTEYISTLKDWNFHKVDNQYRISYHPDLELTEIVYNSHKISLAVEKSRLGWKIFRDSFISCLFNFWPGQFVCRRPGKYHARGGC